MSDEILRVGCIDVNALVARARWSEMVREIMDEDNGTWTERDPRAGVLLAWSMGHVSAVVQVLAERHGMSLILNNAHALWVDNTLDLTERALEMYDQVFDDAIAARGYEGSKAEVRAQLEAVVRDMARDEHPDGRGLSGGNYL